MAVPLRRIALVLPLGALLLSGRSGTFAEGFDSINPTEAIAHVQALASEGSAGRDTPSEGLAKAGEYIADRLKGFGLEPGGENGTWFQGFDVQTKVPSAECRLSWKGGPGEGELKLREDWIPLPGGPDREVKGEP